MLSGVLQLAVAVATITLVLVTGIESIVGLGPAILLAAGALAALPAGRLMDRIGRVPVIAGGFGAGALGCSLVALGCSLDAAPLVIVGFGLVGAMNGAVLLGAYRRGRHGPTRAQSARDLVRALRGAVRRRARAARLPSAVRREGPRARRARRPLAGRSGDGAGRLLVALLIRPDPRTIALELERAADPGRRRLRLRRCGDPAPARRPSAVVGRSPASP